MSKTIMTVFTVSNVPETGLSPVVSIWKVSDNSKVVDEAAATEISNGFYKYTFTSYSLSEDYVILFDGGSGLQSYERYQYGFIRNSTGNYITTVFTENGTPKTGLTPTATAIKISDATVAVSAATMTEIASGFYKYNFSTIDTDEDYAVICDGGSSLNNYERYTYDSSDINNIINQITDDVEINIETSIDLEVEIDSE